MPVITAEVLSLPKETKVKYAKELTQVTSKYTGISEDKLTVFIKENSPENVAAGGTLLSNF